MSADTADAVSPRPAGDPPAIGEDGRLFHERLLPGPGTAAVVVLLAAVVGIAVAPLGTIGALVAGVLALIVGAVVIVLASPVLEVAGGELRLGRAHIPTELLGEPEVLRGEDWQRTMGQDFEPLAHHCTRPWVARGLRIAVLDTEDPTTAWVASTRRPEDLALAVRTAQAATAR